MTKYHDLRGIFRLTLQVENRHFTHCILIANW